MNKVDITFTRKVSDQPYPGAHLYRDTDTGVEFWSEAFDDLLPDYLQPKTVDELAPNVYDIAVQPVPVPEVKAPKAKKPHHG